MEKRGLQLELLTKEKMLPLGKLISLEGYDLICSLEHQSTDHWRRYSNKYPKGLTKMSHEKEYISIYPSIKKNSTASRHTNRAYSLVGKHRKKDGSRPYVPHLKVILYEHEKMKN